MIVKPITFPNHQPLKVVNAKSMLGLLSLDADEQNEMFLVCDGADEEAASAAVLPFFEA